MGINIPCISEEGFFHQTIKRDGPRREWKDTTITMIHMILEDFHSSEEGKVAMIRQRSIWSKSPLIIIFPEGTKQKGNRGFENSTFDNGYALSFSNRLSIEIFCRPYSPTICSILRITISKVRISSK